MPTEWERNMGARLKELREKADVSQAGLAAAVGVSPRTVQYWESNRTFDIEVAVKLADAFGITLDELVGRKRVPKPMAMPGRKLPGRKPKGGAR
jgi:transcriptional regulator with XRE-family HTH domain